jgi:hypothetical protein
MADRGLVHIAKGRIFNNMLYVRNVNDKRPSMYIRDKPIFSPERMLHKDYDRKGSFVKEKESSREPQGDWRHDELIFGKPPIIR